MNVVEGGQLLPASLADSPGGWLVLISCKRLHHAITASCLQAGNATIEVVSKIFWPLEITINT